MKQKTAPIYSKHCLGTLSVDKTDLLVDSKSCLTEVRSLLEKYDVEVIGILEHKFDNESFTIVVSLAESHISIHTWPEHLRVQLDVFLCNYQRDNREACESIYRDICAYFKPTKEETKIIDRL